MLIQNVDMSYFCKCKFCTLYVGMEALVNKWNKEALEKTLATKQAHYWSRSRQEFAAPGESPHWNIVYIRLHSERTCACNGAAVFKPWRLGAPANQHHVIRFTHNISACLGWKFPEVDNDEASSI